jgi:hypothetical protein
MTPAARVRGIFIDAARMERAQQIFLPLMEGADDKAAMIVIPAQERKATLLSSNAPLRVDPIQLAEAPKLNSTQSLLAAIERIRSEDGQALRNGGPGYNDWRHDADRDLYAEIVAARVSGVSERELYRRLGCTLEGSTPFAMRTPSGCLLPRTC